MLRKISATAYINPEEVAAVDAYDSGEPPRPELRRETGTMITLKSGKFAMLKDLPPEEVICALAGDTLYVESPPRDPNHGYDLGPANWPEPWMRDAIEKFQIRALMTCQRDGCGGDLWLFGRKPRVGVCAKCCATYVEDGIRIKHIETQKEKP